MTTDRRDALPSFAAEAPGTALRLDGRRRCSLLVSAGFAYFAHQTEAVLHYRWDWSVIAASGQDRSEDRRNLAPNVLLDGLLTTIRLAVWGLALATIIGVVMGFARTSRRLLPRLIAGAYVILIRNIPPLVFIFIFVFFIASQVLPSLGIAETVDHASETTRWWLSLIFGPPRLIENFAAGLLCLSIFAGAYLTEIVRAGIESVPKSQIEAGDSLGLSRFDILAFVVLPQAVPQRRAAAGQSIDPDDQGLLAHVAGIRARTIIRRAGRSGRDA